jgi:hypothetical protein
MYALLRATSRSRLSTAMHIYSIVLDSQPTLLCYHKLGWTTRRHSEPVWDMLCHLWHSIPLLILSFMHI